MAGLLRSTANENVSQRAAPQAAAAPRRGTASPEAAGDEEQAVYENFVRNGLRLIHDQNGMQGIMALVDSGNPVEGLANALVSVLTRLTDTAAAQGMDISREVVMQGGSELFAEMADLVEEADIHKFKQEELEAALALGLQIFTMTGQKQQAGQPAAQTEAGARRGLLPAPQMGNI